MRIALGIEYSGHGYFGWQAQNNLLTIQGCLEQALSQIANHSIQLFCAGRTDAGVHATYQVAHFDTTASRVIDAWVRGTNAHLPSTIAVKWAQPVDENFHARFSAQARCYRYIIYNTPVQSALLAQLTTWHRPSLDSALMQQASQYLLGEQDFSSFRSSMCEASSPKRNIHFIQVMRQKDYVVVDIQANAFLHHMVRNIVGTLMVVGMGLQKPEWLQDVLHAKNRCIAGKTASAAGLYLCRVIYPPPYIFPHADANIWVF